MFPNGNLNISKENGILSAIDLKYLCVIVLA